MLSTVGRTVMPMERTEEFRRPVRVILSWTPWVVGLGYAGCWGINGLLAGFPFFAGAALFWSSVLILFRDAIGAKPGRGARIPADAVVLGASFLFGWEGGIAILPGALAFLVADTVDPATPALPTGGSLRGGGVVVLAAGALALVVSIVLAGGLYSSATSIAVPPLGLSNGTPLTVALYVNGQHVVDSPSGEPPPTIDPAGLPPLPWIVEARSPSGRVLTSMHVAQGDVGTTDGGSHGVLGRVDLSCGRITIWAGSTQPSGPAPPPSPGIPGDCAP